MSHFTIYSQTFRFALAVLTAYALLEINGITLNTQWYIPVASWYTIYGITN